jgi:hypothetical protein
VCTFFVFPQITGINVPRYYGPKLLGHLFEGAGTSTVDTTIAGVEVTSSMTAVNVAATYFGFRYIDRVGRRKLGLGDYTGMAVFAVGVGGVGWLIEGEAFPTAVRGQAAATCDWPANFALVEVFPVWNSSIGLNWVLVCFAALCVMAFGFVARYLHETKGLPVERATEAFQGDPRAARAA